MIQLGSNLRSILLLLFVLSAAAKWSKHSVVSWWSSVRFTDVSEHYRNSPKTQCIAFCDRMDECLSVNHNSDTNKCELTTHDPRAKTPMQTTESNWRVYYKDDHMIPAKDAWQVSTKTTNDGKYLAADLAIDGNRDNSGWHNCAVTDDTYSSWTMKFEQMANVSFVVIYFNAFLQYNHWNANLRLLISETRWDSVNNIGTDCATYIGPPESPVPPVMLTCSQPVVGKFLKIIHDFSGNLVLCEVQAYSN